MSRLDARLIGAHRQAALELTESLRQVQQHDDRGGGRVIDAHERAAAQLMGSQGHEVDVLAEEIQRRYRDTRVALQKICQDLATAEARVQTEILTPNAALRTALTAVYGRTR